MKTRKLAFVLVTGVALLAGCVSSEKGRSGKATGNARLYQASQEATIGAAANAMSGLGLAMDEGDEYNERTYMLQGRELRSADGSSPPIQVGLVNVYVERTTDSISRVWVETERTRRGGGSGLGGGGDGSLGNSLRKDYAERILGILDDELDVVEAEQGEVSSR